ncbi:hypothetical protein HID58_038394, partial [Brassica napus]
ASSLLCRFDIVPVDSPFKLQLRSYLLILQSPSMASSLLPQDLIVKPDNGLMFTILRRSSSTGSLQVPASSICFDGFVATAVKSPSDQNSGQNPAVKGFVGSEPPKIDSSVPQVENYKDAGGEDVNEDSTATVAPVDSVIVQNLVTVEGSSTTETIQKSDVASSPSLGAWEKPLRIYLSSPSAVDVLHEAGSNLLQELSSPSHWPSLSDGQHRSAKNHTRAPQLTNRVTNKALVKPKLPAPEVKEDGNLRFPWAAKMNPSTRNLYRTTSPSYLEDGTPMVTIPSKLLLHVIPDGTSISASATVANIDSATILTVSTPVVAVASVTGTPDVAIPSDTENIPTFMAPSPTVNIGSIHAPPTSYLMAKY